MNQIVIELPELHKGQQDLFDSAKRFNVVRCGRRWGKTICAADLLIETALDGFPAGYFTPKYKTLEEVWNEVVRSVEPLISKKNSQLKYIKLITGGMIEFWSLKEGNAPRSRKYKREVIDEAAFVDGLKDKWGKTLRPMLVDYQGDAWFFSSPNGYNDFYELSKMEQKFPSKWKSFHRPSANNPYLSKRELLDIKEETPTDVYMQEYDAEFVNFDGKSFLQYFSRETNVEPLSVLPYLDVYLCFDFNIVNTVLIIQRPDEYTTHVVKEIHSDLYDLRTLCQSLIVELPNAFFIINGDASGRAGSALTSGNESAYDIIKSSLDLRWEQFNVPAANPSHLNSYLLSNFIFKNHKVFIDPSCEGLITDCERVKVQQVNGKFSIVKTDDKLTHHLDPLRYHLNAECKQLLSEGLLEEN